MDPRDLDHLVRTVYGEAGGEAPVGQQAVAAVIMNRSRTSGQPVSAIVSAPGQFEAWHTPRVQNLRPDSPAYQRIAATIQPLVDGTVADPTNGADHFLAPNLQTSMGRAMPRWAQSGGTDIGNQRFFRVGYTHPAGGHATPAAPQSSDDIFGFGGHSAAAPAGAPQAGGNAPASSDDIFGFNAPQRRPRPASVPAAPPPAGRPSGPQLVVEPPTGGHAPPRGMTAQQAVAAITAQMRGVRPAADRIAQSDAAGRTIHTLEGLTASILPAANVNGGVRPPALRPAPPPPSGTLAQQRYGQVRPNARNATEMAGFAAMPAIGSGQAPTQTRGILDQVVSNLGFGDELRGGAAYLRQGAGNIGRQIAGQPIEVSGADAYHAGAQADRTEQSRFSADNPGMNGLATVLGIGTAGAPNAMRTTVAAGAGPVMRTGRAIVNAGLSNFPFALANQNGTLAERLPGAVADTAVAAGASGALHGAGETLAAMGARTRAAPLTPARQISNQGVELTTGQMAGGGLQRVEDALVSTPILGDTIRARQAEGIDSFNRAGWNQVLAPLGEHLPQRVAVGRDALNHTEARVSHAYTTALRPVRVGPDATLVRDLQTVISQQADPRVADNLRTVLAQTILPRFSGRVPGQQWKAIDEELGALRRSADSASGTDPMQRYFANGLGDMQTAFRGTLQRQHPNASAQVDRANAAHAQLVRFRDAMEAASTSRRGGVVTPAQLNTAVARDAAGHSFARGDALMQNLTEPAMQVLPPTVPDSGTGLRTLINSPLKALTTAAVTVPLAAGYSRTVQGAANHVYRANSPANRAVVQDLLALAAGQAARNPVLLQGAAQQLRSSPPPALPPSYPPRQLQPIGR